MPLGAKAIIEKRIYHWSGAVMAAVWEAALAHFGRFMLLQAHSIASVYSNRMCDASMIER